MRGVQLREGDVALDAETFGRFIHVARDLWSEKERLIDLLRRVRVREHGGIEPQLDAEIDAALNDT